MSINNDEMKDTLLFRDRETAIEMFKFIQEKLAISDANMRNFIGYEIISVNSKEYERVLLEARKYAIEKDYGMFWIDYYDERRSPIASMDIGYGMLPESLLDGEKKRNDRHLWTFEKRRPSILNKYLGLMKKHLGDEIIRIDVEYRGADNALVITSVTKDVDYDKYNKLLAEFIAEYGYGPFTEIHPLTFTGKYVEEPFQFIKK